MQVVMEPKFRKSETCAKKIARWKKLSQEARESGIRYESFDAFARGVGLRKNE